MTFKNPQKKDASFLRKYTKKNVITRCSISDVYKVIFILIAKNATSTMREYMKNNLYAYEQRYVLCSKEQKQYYTFCILRNSEERFYSAIRELQSRYKLYKNNNPTICHLNYIISILNNDNLKYYIDTNLDHHLAKQSEFIKNIRIDAYVDINLLSKFGLLPKRQSKKEEKDQLKVKMKIDSDILTNVYHEDNQLFSKCNTLDEETFKNKLRLL